MEDLIEALQIFLKYRNLRNPTHCSHDELAIMGITKDEVGEEDLKRLDELGFFWSDEEDGYFMSFRFGSA
jgi:hypothetical protein